MNRRTFFRRTAGMIATAVMAPYLSTPVTTKLANGSTIFGVASYSQLMFFAGRRGGKTIEIRKLMARVRITEEAIRERIHRGPYLSASR